MGLFYIKTYETLEREYAIEADSEDQARELIFEGEFGPMMNENLEHLEIINIQKKG